MIKTNVISTFRQFSQIATVNEVVSFEEYFTQPGFSNWIILEIEFVESMERILMSVHVKGIDR